MKDCVASTLCHNWYIIEPQNYICIMTYSLQAFILTQKINQLNFFNCYQAVVG